MKNNLYGVNGLRFWTEHQLHIREMFKKHIQFRIREELMALNPAWRFVEVEAPLLTPRSHINQNYTDEDIWVQENKEDLQNELVLRPETTPGSYLAASSLMSENNFKPPFVVSQFGKSFRREQLHSSKHCRFKEFWQYEFQCLYASDTKNDYHSAILEPIRQIIAEMISLPTRIVESDRLPDYSDITIDVEVDNGDKWMEVCSISRRKDFPHPVYFQTKKGVVERNIFVLEISIGMDRCVYNYEVAQATK